jgi:hypothetical protein
MAIPEAESARVDRGKLTGYLLSESHPIGRSKAKYFRGIGFDESNATLLEQGLLGIARSEAVVESMRSRHGMKYIVDGAIATPLGSRVKLRTIWIIEQGQEHPIRHSLPAVMWHWRIYNDSRSRDGCAQARYS